MLRISVARLTNSLVCARQFLGLPVRLSSSSSVPREEKRYSPRSKVQSCESDYLDIQLHGTDGKFVEKFSHMWLRDHCRCPSCYTEATFQREFNVRDLPTNPTPASVDVSGDKLEIIWQDGHKSDFPLEWLSKHSYTGYMKRLKAAYERRQPWLGGEFKSVPIERIQVQDLLNDKSGAVKKRAFESLWDYGVVFIENVAPNVQATREALEYLAPLMKTTWGEAPHVFQADEARSDSAYSTKFVGPHNDNTYFTEAAGLIALACYRHDGTGGESSLLDGLMIAEQFKKFDPEGYDFLRNNPIPSEYREERPGHTYHFVSTDYIFKHDPVTDHLVQVRYNIYDRAPMSNMDAETSLKFYQHYRNLNEVIGSMEDDNWFKLKPGQMMVADNFRVFHARNGFTGSRVMVSAYMQRGEFLSGARTMGIIP